MNKPIIVLLTLCTLAITSRANAHVRWFIIDRDIPQLSFTFDAINLLTLCGALTLVVLSKYLDSLSLDHQASGSLVKRLVFFVNKPVSTLANIQWMGLIIALNILFLVNLMMGDFFAPNLVLPPTLMMLGVVVQAAAILLSSCSISLTGIALVLVGLALPMVFKTSTGLDYFFEVIGVGLAYLCIAPTLNAHDNKLYQRLTIFNYVDKVQLQRLAIVILRVALGAQLITLAFNNKLLEPGAAWLFLQDFPFYNFMAELGFEQYSNLHFVFAAGIFEATLGALLILGWAPRFIALTLLSFFTITTVLSGPTEIIGHLPIFGVLTILILAGEQAKTSPITNKTLQTLTCR